MPGKRIPLSPVFHAEPGETKYHLHDVYTTEGELGGNKRVHVGTLMKCAVQAWADGRRQALEEAAAICDRANDPANAADMAKMFAKRDLVAIQSAMDVTAREIRALAKSEP